MNTNHVDILLHNMLFKSKRVRGMGVQDKPAPVDFSEAVAGGWADGGWWMQLEMMKDGDIHNLRPYGYRTNTHIAYILNIHTQKELLSTFIPASCGDKL